MNRKVVALPNILKIVMMSFETACTTNMIAMNLAQLHMTVSSIIML